MKNKAYELVRDLFVFPMFTGLAYADVRNLTYDNLQTFFDGEPVDYHPLAEDQHRATAS